MYRASYEDLVKLVNERGKFEVESDDGREGTLRINLADSGYSKKYIPLEVVLNELFPEHEPDFGLDKIYPEDENTLKVWMPDKNWREIFNNKDEKEELLKQKAVDHVKETAELRFYGDTNVPDVDKEVVCKVTFNTADYFEDEVLEYWFRMVTEHSFENYKWAWQSSYSTDENTLTLVLASFPYMERKFQELGESF